MSFDIAKFFNPAYFFDPRPTISREALIGMLIFFGLFVVAAIVLKVVQKTKKREGFVNIIFNKYFNWSLVLGLLGLLMAWFRYEKPFFLSSRYWLIVWVAVLFVWLWRIVVYQFKTAPQARKQSEQRRIFNQYLPKKK